MMANNSIIKREAIEQVKRTDNEWRDCFTALCFAFLQEYFISSDSKFFVIRKMYHNLKLIGYNETEIDNFKKFMKEVVAKIQTKNDFMG